MISCSTSSNNSLINNYWISTILWYLQQILHLSGQVRAIEHKEAALWLVFFADIIWVVTQFPSQDHCMKTKTTGCKKDLSTAVPRLQILLDIPVNVSHEKGSIYLMSCLWHFYWWYRLKHFSPSVILWGPVVFSHIAVCMVQEEHFIHALKKEHLHCYMCITYSRDY